MRTLPLLLALLFALGGFIYSYSDANHKESERRERYQHVANTELVLEEPARHVTVRGCYSDLILSTVVVRNSDTEKTVHLTGLVSGHRGGDEQHWFRALAPGATVEIPLSLQRYSGRILVEDETGTIGLFPIGCHAR